MPKSSGDSRNRVQCRTLIEQNNFYFSIFTLNPLNSPSSCYYSKELSASGKMS